MNLFTPYSVKDSDRFDEQLYTLVVREIAVLQERLREIKSAQKTSIVISVLKDHSIKTEWLDSNKHLARLLTSGVLSTAHLESLFNSCRNNAIFRSGLEEYITRKLA